MLSVLLIGRNARRPLEREADRREWPRRRTASSCRQSFEFRWRPHRRFWLQAAKLGNGILPLHANRIAGGISRLIVHAVRAFVHESNAEQLKEALEDVFAMRIAELVRTAMRMHQIKKFGVGSRLRKEPLQQLHAMTGGSERLRHIEDQGLFGSRKVRKKTCCRSILEAAA